MDDNLIMRTLSDNLRELEDLRGLSIDAFAELCGLSASTFKKHLYCENLIPLATLILICDTHKASINFMFKGLIEVTEQDSINKTVASLKSLSEEKQRRIKTILHPFAESVVRSYPVLEGAKFGTRLRILRKEFDYTSQKVADYCNIELSTLKNYESSDILPGVPTFLCLCRLFGVSPEFFLCNIATYLIQDIHFYSFTPSQLSGFASTVEKLCAYYS